MATEPIYAEQLLVDAVDPLTAALQLLDLLLRERIAQEMPPS